MQPETLQQFRDDIARNRYERDAYRSRAAAKWKEYLWLNRQRRYLDAFTARDRHHEYKRTAAQYDAEMRRLKALIAA